ncbi:chemotaxis protein, partial [Vibrio anguillarum]|nr:chemotaxis protein [Vibrio anguillarum]
AHNARHLHSLDIVHHQNQEEYSKLSHSFYSEAQNLHELLQTLYDNLRIAQIISIMLSVEASQADERYQAQLQSIANNVAELAKEIQAHVML